MQAAAAPSQAQPHARPGSPLAEPGAVLLVSCYELGHQPFAVASAWAMLQKHGFGVDGVDASVQTLDDTAIDRARLIAISVPMHTALRLGVAIGRRARARNPAAHICFFGLYASLNADYLLNSIADSVIGGEFELALVDLAGRLATGRPQSLPQTPPAPVLDRLAFERPRREGLPPLDRYAKLLGPAEGQERTVGYVEASRGCLHRCRHCPVTPVYEGRFFVVPRAVVLADAEQQIASGARHITFGDPDFLNGAGHCMAIARALAEAHPGITFDITTKVEHILKHRDRFAELARLGCIFAVSALESLSDRVLSELDKGHTRADIYEALRITREAGIALRPSFVAFTPWTAVDDYVSLCDFILEESLIDHTDPIQLAIRLLVPPGSALLRGDSLRPFLGPLEADQFGYRWTHPDPRMDTLHAVVSRIVEDAASIGEDAADTFARIREAAYEMAGRQKPRPVPAKARRFVPKLTEPWFCCAEPNAAQMDAVSTQGGGACCGSSGTGTGSAGRGGEQS